MAHPPDPELYHANRRKRAARLAAARAIATHTPEQWAEVLAETAPFCVRCSRTATHRDKDHVVPLYQGGSDGIDNLQPLCARCNAEKGPENVNWLAIWRAERGE